MKRKLTEEHKRKISQTLKGHSVSQETREKLRKKAKERSKEILELIRIRTKEAMQKPEIRRKTEKTQYKKGNIPWITGRRHSKETRLKISRNTKKAMQGYEIKSKISNNTKRAMRREEIRRKIEKTFFKKGITPWNKGKTGVYSEEVIEKLRKARLSRIFPKKDTYIEVLMQEELKKRRIYFEKHKVLFKRLQPDLIFNKEKLVVFCDGDYWHANPSFLKKRKKYKLDKPQISNIKRDETHNLILKENNWKYLRFWESDIKRNVKECVDQIENHLKRSTKATSTKISTTSKTSTKAS